MQGGRPAIGGGEGFKRLPPEEGKVPLRRKSRHVRERGVPDADPKEGTGKFWMLKK